MIGALGCRVLCALLRPLAALVATGTGTTVVVAVRPDGPQVALTVDDGPHPATTPALLEVLARHGARATFFLHGERAERYPELLRAIAADGHELANHLERDQWSVRLPRAEFERQLHAVHDLLTPHGPVRFFRPGSGWFSRRMLRAAAALHYRCALGSPLLATTATGPGTGARLAGRCHPGAVVVLHEGTAARAGVAGVADELLAGLTARALRATSLGTLVP